MSQYNSASVRKRQREQEKQRRRLQIKSASRDHSSGSAGSAHSSGSAGSAGEVPAPLFGPIQKKDGGNELQKFAKNVLGDYQTAIRSIAGNDQRRFLGTVETTPSTPVIPSRQNPFEENFRAGAVGTTSSGLAATSSRSSGSRHQVAEPPASGVISKKEKNRPHPKHAKTSKSVVSSKPHPSNSSASTHESSRAAKKSTGSSGAHGSGDVSADVRPTNRLVVSGGSKRTSRPFRPAPSPSHPGSAAPSKSKLAKPPAGSLAPTDLFKVDTRTERVGPHSHSNSSSSSSSSKFSKSKRTHGESLPQGSSSLSDPPPHSSSTSSSASSSSSGHKSSTSTFSSSSPSTGTTAPSSGQSAHSHSHKLKKASTNPSISISSCSKESLDTKISVPLRKTGSSDSVSVPSRLLPSPTLGPRPPPTLEESSPAPSSIDIGQLHRMKLEPASSDAAPPGHLLSRKKDKKLKKKIKKSKDRPLSGERSTEPMQVETTEVKPVVVKLEPQETVPVSAFFGKPSNVEGVSSCLTSVPGHMTASEDHVMPSWLNRMPEASKLSKRPSSIKIASSAGLGVQEVSMESGDVQNMLDEMMRPVPSLVTPIPTPKKNKSFAFPTSYPPLSRALQSRPSPPPMLKHPGKRPFRPLSNTSSEESDGESKEAVITAVTILDTNLAAESTLPPVAPALRHKAPPTSSGSSSESSSSSDSSSSDSDSSSEEEEEEETITPMLEKLSKELPHSSNMVTPITKTPPHVSITLISPLADDAANLSPPKFTSGNFPIGTSQAYSQPTSVYSQPTSVYSQSSSLSASVYSQATSAHCQPNLIFTSQSFPPMATTTESAFSAESVQPRMEESDSNSSSDSENDSGMESDSESSDSEEQSSEDEETRKNHNTTPQSSRLGSLPEELVLFGQGGSSGGFWEDTDFMGGMGVTGPLGSQDVKPSETMETIQHPQESFTFDISTQPFDFPMTQDHVEQRESYNSESGNSAQKTKKLLEGGVSNQKPKLAGNPQQLPHPQPGSPPQPGENNSRKRKQQQQQQKLEEEIVRESAPESQPSPPKLPKIRIKIPQPPPKSDSPLLSPSVFSENESSSSSNSDEDEPEDVTVVPTMPNPPATLEASTVGTGVLQQDDGEGRGEVGGRSVQEEGPNLMMVRIPLCLVDLSREPQKPKATVEPYHVTAPSKTAKRRTSEAAEREEVPHRRVSHSDYGRHRDDLDRNSEYSRDYRGHEEEHGRPHRDGRSWEGPPREHRLLSGSDELPPRAGRRRGRGERGAGEYRERGSSRETWERDREHYHRERPGDQYWPGYEHYERREFDETVTRRPRYRADNRGDTAEYYLQEAKRKKHDADKIGVSGVEKAKAYMESVVYFMRHGDALEHDHQAYRMYHDTITMVKCCQSMAGDLKSLVVLCLRCQSVLYWRMYMLKHTTVYQIQKELQHYFVLPKNTQKSPHPSSFSPLPSPTSVGSTASASSTSSQDPSPSSAAISVPKHIFNKAAEHLNIATFVTQSYELWKHSDVLIEQCRDFFMNLHRKASRITQFSSVRQVADWVEFGLRSSRWT